MASKYWAISALTLLAAATGALAADDKTPSPSAAPAPAAAPSAATKNPADLGIKIQFGAPKDLTLKEAQKQAHERAEKLDKMTVQEWAQGRQKFREDMAKISKMTPEEKRKLFPGVPDSVLSRLSSPKAETGKTPSDDPAVALENARKNAHAQTDKLDKTSEKEWNERRKRIRALMENYKKMQQHPQDKVKSTPNAPKHEDGTSKPAADEK